MHSLIYEVWLKYHTEPAAITPSHTTIIYGSIIGDNVEKCLFYFSSLFLEF